MYLYGKNAVKTLRDEYASWINALSYEEKHALRKYTFNSKDFKKPNRFFERLNAMLRGSYSKDKPDYNMLVKYANVISSALQKHPIEHNVICYRGTSYNPAVGYNIGETFFLDAFTSTSVSRNQAFNLEYLSIIYVPVGSRAAYIEKISCFYSQKELLLDKKTLVKLKSISRDGKILEMEVCG